MVKFTLQVFVDPSCKNSYTVKSGLWKNWIWFEGDPGLISGTGPGSTFQRHCIINYFDISPAVYADDTRLNIMPKLKKNCKYCLIVTSIKHGGFASLGLEVSTPNFLDRVLFLEKQKHRPTLRSDPLCVGFPINN